MLKPFDDLHKTKNKQEGKYNGKREVNSYKKDNSKLTKWAKFSQQSVNTMIDKLKSPQIMT